MAGHQPSVLTTHTYRDRQRNLRITNTKKVLWSLNSQRILLAPLSARDPGGFGRIPPTAPVPPELSLVTKYSRNGCFATNPTRQRGKRPASIRPELRAGGSVPAIQPNPPFTRPEREPPQSDRPPFAQNSGPVVATRQFSRAVSRGNAAKKPAQIPADQQPRHQRTSPFPATPPTGTQIP